VSVSSTAKYALDEANDTVSDRCRGKTPTDAFVRRSGTPRADDLQPPSSPKLCVVVRAVLVAALINFPLFCAVAGVVAPAFDPSGELAATSARATREAAQALGQRRVGIVSEMLPGCRLGVCMRVGAAF